MNITSLKEFNFYIGNTTDEFSDVTATNRGIEVDGNVVAAYDKTMDVSSADDLMEIIDDAIAHCKSFSEDDRSELGTYLGAEYDINDWWEENYE